MIALIILVVLVVPFCLPLRLQFQLPLWSFHISFTIRFTYTHAKRARITHRTLRVLLSRKVLRSVNMQPNNNVVVCLTHKEITDDISFTFNDA